MTDWFYDLLPMAITYGMSVKEFWEDNPDLFWAYRFSYYEKIKNEQEMFNYNAWLQGAYFYDAISIALSNGFGKAHLKYPDKPFGVMESIEQVDNQRKKQVEMQVADIRARIKQINKMKSSTTEGNKTEGGERINERTNIRNAN